MDRLNLFRVAAIAVVTAIFITVFTMNRLRPARSVTEPQIAGPDIPHASDDLAAELARCRGLSPKDAVDPHCAAVWEENRRRFFGKPARPLPPPPPGTAAPAIAGDVHG